MEKPEWMRMVDDALGCKVVDPPIALQRGLSCKAKMRLPQGMRVELKDNKVGEPLVFEVTIRRRANAVD